MSHSNSDSVNIFRCYSESTNSSADNQSKRVVSPHGHVYWTEVDDVNKLHRIDGPAVISPDGLEEWWQHGKRHRTDGPAITNKWGREEWYFNGFRHREGGPAYKDSNGYRGWWIRSRRHRKDGPAVIRPDGTYRWFLNDELFHSPESWAIAVLKMEGQPHDNESVHNFLRTILKQSVGEVL